MHRWILGICLKQSKANNKVSKWSRKFCLIAGTLHLHQNNPSCRVKLEVSCLTVSNYNKLVLVSQNKWLLLSTTVLNNWLRNIKLVKFVSGDLFEDSKRITILFRESKNHIPLNRSNLVSKKMVKELTFILFGLQMIFSKTIGLNFQM